MFLAVCISLFVIAFVVLMSISIVDGYSPRPPISRKPKPTLSERIMQRECDLGMCEIAGHDHSGITYDGLLSAGKIHKSQVDNYRREVAESEYIHAKRELERVQKQLAAVEMEVADFKHKFRYRKYETDDFENEYTVHEITAFGGEKMIYTEKYPISYYADDVFSRRENGYNPPPIRPAPPIPTKRTWKF